MADRIEGFLVVLDDSLRVGSGPPSESLRQHLSQSLHIWLGVLPCLIFQWQNVATFKVVPCSPTFMAVGEPDYVYVRLKVTRWMYTGLDGAQLQLF